MDIPNDNDSEQNMAAPSRMSAAAIVAIGELLAALVKLRPFYLIYGALTWFAALLMVAIRHLARLGNPTLRAAVADLRGAKQYLRHPPQTWAAP